MTMPPPPPDRMHLQHQPPPQQQPPMQSGPQQMGPGGAYGAAQYSPGQPVPGQMPSAAMSMSKPGTITGIQVILYLFLAISSVGNVLSIMSMVEFFNPFSLISLGFAVYSTIQSLASGVQIARGKRWAWIWSLISAILGLALSLTMFIYGVIVFDAGGDIMLTIAAVLVGLYGTLLGLLCSKSARQWILMHRIQRGEVQAPGMAMGGMAMGGMPQGGPAAPSRPETRPGAVTIAALVLGLIAALAAWRAWLPISEANRFLAWARENGTQSPGSYSLYDQLFSGGFPPPGFFVVAYAVVFVCAAITIPALLKGSAFGRIFGLIWSIPAILLGGYAMYFVMETYNRYFAGTPAPLFSGPQPNGGLPFGWHMVGGIAFLVGTLIVFIAMLVPGVKAWTPTQPATALIMMVPAGQPQAPQQQGPYGQPQQGGYPPQQQQPPYPPQY